MVKYPFVISRIPIKTSIYGEFPIAMFDYRRVHNQLVFIDSGWRLFWSILGSLSHFGLVDFEILRFAKGLTCNVEVLFSNLFGMISFDRWLFGRIVFGFARCMRVQPMAKMGIWWNSMKHGAIASLFQTHSHYPLVVIYIYIYIFFIYLHMCWFRNSNWSRAAMGQSWPCQNDPKCRLHFPVPVLCALSYIPNSIVKIFGQY